MHSDDAVLLKIKCIQMLVVYRMKHFQSTYHIGEIQPHNEFDISEKQYNPQNEANKI